MDDGAEIYKAQTLAVESLLAHHPEFDPAVDPIFSTREREVFKAVFQPDWNEYNDSYKEAFSSLVQTNPKMMIEAQEVLKKFLAAHGVDPKGLELNI